MANHRNDYTDVDESGNEIFEYNVMMFSLLTVKLKELMFTKSKRTRFKDFHIKILVEKGNQCSFAPSYEDNFSGIV